MESLHLLQAKYWASVNSLESAKLIIQRKGRNMAQLLKQYLPFRQKYYPDQAKVLRNSITSILNLTAVAAPDRRGLFLLEARTTRLYWQGFGLLARCPAGWKRVYPHAQDPWSLALNIGYSLLANFLRPKLSEREVSLEIGMLHTPQRFHEALLYDFQELFRQPFVDAAILPLFSRNRPEKIKPGQIAAVVTNSFKKLSRYNHEWITFGFLIEKELNNYIAAMKQNKIFIPYNHSWAHWTK